MGIKKDDSGAIPESSFECLLGPFYPCPLNGVQFNCGRFFVGVIVLIFPVRQDVQRRVVEVVN